MLDRPTLADRYAQIDPAELSVDQVLTYTLVQEVVGLRGDVVAERKGREISISAARRANRLSLAAVLVIVLFVAGGVVNWRIDDARYSRSTCAERIARSDQIRDGIVGVAPAVVDAVAEFGGLPESKRAQVAEIATEAATKSVAKDIPPPDC